MADTYNNQNNRDKPKLPKGIHLCVLWGFLFIKHSNRISDIELWRIRGCVRRNCVGLFIDRLEAKDGLVLNAILIALYWSKLDNGSRSTKSILNEEQCMYKKQQLSEGKQDR